MHRYIIILDGLRYFHTRHKHSCEIGAFYTNNDNKGGLIIKNLEFTSVLKK